MKKFIFALITLILGTHAQAQISGSLLPSDISWDQVNLILAVQQVKGYSGNYQYITTAQKVGDSVVIISDTIQSQGTGTKRSTIEKLSPDTWYQVYWIFWDSVRVDSIKGPLIKTAPIPERVTITTREIPRLSVSGIMVVVPPRPYLITVSGVYTKRPDEPYGEFITPIDFPADKSNIDSAQLFLFTPNYSDYLYCLFIDYPDNVPYKDTLLMCSTLKLEVPPLTPAPLLELAYQSVDCGQITAGVRIIPEVIDTASMVVIIEGESLPPDTIGKFIGIDNLITLEVDAVGLDPNTTYYFKVIGESKDGEKKELIFSVTTPPSTGKPTLNSIHNIESQTVRFIFSGSMRCATGFVTISINDTLTIIPVGAGQYAGEYDIILPPGNYSYEVCATSSIGNVCVSGDITIVTTAIIDLEINRNDIPPDATVIIYDTMGRLIRDCKWLDVVNKTDNPFGLSGVYIVSLLNQDYVEKRVWVQ